MRLDRDGGRDRDGNGDHDDDNNEQRRPSSSTSRRCTEPLTSTLLNDDQQTSTIPERRRRSTQTAIGRQILAALRTGGDKRAATGEKKGRRTSALVGRHHQQPVEKPTPSGAGSRKTASLSPAVDTAVAASSPPLLPVLLLDSGSTAYAGSQLEERLALFCFLLLPIDALNCSLC